MKPKYLETEYIIGATIDIEDVEEKLKISWGDVKDYHVKWCTLHLAMKDGSYLEFGTGDNVPDPANCDYKRPITTTLYTENYDLLERE
jgi:hypothetical protein